MKLTKDESRRRWRELRDLWNEWYPIGVVPDGGGPDDEYDSYVGPTMRLLERNASAAEIERYLEQIVGEHMGLDAGGVEYVRSTGFAEKLRAWFSSRWPDSRL